MKFLLISLFFLLTSTLNSECISHLETHNVKYKKNKTLSITTLNLEECKAMVPNVKVHLDWVIKNIPKKNRIIIVNEFFSKPQIEAFFENVLMLDEDEFNVVVSHELTIAVNNNSKRETEMDKIRAYSSRAILIDPNKVEIFNDYIRMLGQNQDKYNEVRKKLAKK